MRDGEPGHAVWPRHLPVALTGLLGMPPLVSGRFDLRHPAVGAIASRERGLGWVLGVRVASGAELVAELTTGASATFISKKHGEVTELRGARSHFAVVDSLLVMASHGELLSDYGPYLARVVLTQAGEQAWVNASGDAMVTLTPKAGELLARQLNVASVARLLEAELAGGAAFVAGAAPLGDGLSPWVAGGLSALERGLRGVREGKVMVKLGPSQLQFSGQLAVPGYLAREDSRLAPFPCEKYRLSDEVQAAALVSPGLLAVWSASWLATLDEGKPGPAEIDAGVLRTLLTNPVLFSLYKAERRAVLSLSGQVDTEGSSGNLAWPLALLRTPTFERMLGPHRFPAVPPAGANRVASRADEPIELAWAANDGLATWAFGPLAASFLEQPPSRPASHSFESWSVLCDAEPVFAVGLGRGTGGIELAVVRRSQTLSVEGRLPLAMARAWTVGAPEEGGP